MNKQRNKKILIVLIVFTLAFIFGNSLIDRENSSKESSWVLVLVQPFLEFFVGRGNVTEHLVRKLAHFSEFALLGFELCLFFQIQAGTLQKAVLLSVSHGLFSALTDETVQIFSHRGPQIQDVWLDTAGAVFGVCITLLLLLFCNSASGNQKKRKKTA